MAFGPILPNSPEQFYAACGGKTVTPNDSADVFTNGFFRGLYIGSAGDVTVLSYNGDLILYKAVPVGTQLSVAGTRVMATGTTSTSITAVR